MTSTSDCTLSVTVASTDAPFLGLMLPHIGRASHFPFARFQVFADLEPVSATFVRRPPGSIDELRRSLEKLRAEGVIDEVIGVEADSALAREAWKGRLRRRPAHIRDYRGSPIASYLLSLALCPTRYLLHLDADMLVHQPADARSWVQTGIELLEANEDIAAVLPLSGPPHPAGRLHQRVPYTRDPRGFYRFRSFTSRIFLVDRTRIEGLYPLDPGWPVATPPGRMLGNVLHRLRGQSTLPTWELMMERAMRGRGWYRADLMGPAWSLHPHARGEEFVRLLPRIVADVEAGRFPPEQAGRYNMNFDAWRAWHGAA
jgi:hypothetical protein